MNLTKDFKRSEFRCKCGKCSFDNIDPRIVTLCQTIRDALNEPLRINSGCCCVEYNRKVDGVQESYHTKGMAADLSCKSGSKRLFEVIVALDSRGKLPFGLSYVQHYRKSNFVHIDVGKTRAKKFVEVDK